MIREMRIRNYSERTISSYISILAQFSTYYKRSPDQLSLNQLKDYARYLLEVKKNCPFRHQSTDQCLENPAGRYLRAPLDIHLRYVHACIFYLFLKPVYNLVHLL